MVETAGRIARFKIVPSAEGNRYVFYCDLSGAMVCTTNPIVMKSPEKELQFAWESEGKKCFNLCHSCGKWVSDPVYNVETFSCVQCTPWEEIPMYCPHCGERAEATDVFCSRCKKRLRYGNENNKTDSGMLQI